jgi:hypothetical protein
MSEIKKLEIWHYLMRKHKAVYGNFAGDIFNLSKANGAGLEMDNPSLDYDMMDRMPFGGLIGKKIIRLIKSNKRVRPLAYKIYRLFNK